MSTNEIRPDTDEVTDLEPLEPIEEPRELPVEEGGMLDSPEYEFWRKSYLNDKLPSLFLDRSLKILAANDGFCRMYGCTTVRGVYLTKFFAPYFDETRSAELFRTIVSPQVGFTWNGRVERIGMDELLNISKVWVMPVFGSGSPTPRAFAALCLDMTLEYRHLMQTTFASLLGAARLKDNDTGNHIERVNCYARVLSQRLVGRHTSPPVDKQFVESISQVAALHDVGKIGTPDDILNKAGPLESWEWDVMKQHTTNGAYILATYPNPMAREIALRHHEKWDGSGYPHGLSGELIPLPARIVAIADVYDALRMRRTYKEPYTHSATLDIMKKEQGTHFDPGLLDSFHSIAGEFDRIFSELADSP